MKHMRLGLKPDAFQSDTTNIRFVACELGTDITINVGDVKFYLHKFPLLPRSSRLQRLVASINGESGDEINIPDIPGGPEAFEICAKFCYGMFVTLNAYNVVAARCAAEYLEMRESIEKGNLIYKIDVFLATSVFRSWKDMIIVLQTTKHLQPWTEKLKIVSRCIDSIASKASVDPAEVDWSYTYHKGKLPLEDLLNEHWRKQSVPNDWWVEDLCELEMDSYKRVIQALKTKGRVPEDVIGRALKAYAYRRLLGFCESAIPSEGDIMKYGPLLETIVWLLPIEKGSVSCNFLLELLKAASFLDCSEDCKTDLIKRIAQQLEEASVSYLLLPALVGGSTLYDIDLILNVIEGFLMDAKNSAECSLQTSKCSSGNRIVAVSKLIDGCLAEAATDPNLPLSKFVELAEIMSCCYRPVHDGLYYAIDVFLKEHPELTKSEKKNICSLVDCRKLSPDACLHAVQNDRLPLRVVVKVLFVEQVRRSAGAVCGPDLSSGGDQSLVSQENDRTSHGRLIASSMNNSGKEWTLVPTLRDISSLEATKVVRSEMSSGSGDTSKSEDEDKAFTKRIGLSAKGLLRKLSSVKVQGGKNSGSDASEDPRSINHYETKLAKIPLSCKKILLFWKSLGNT